MIHFSNYVVDSRVQRQARALANRGDEVVCIGLARSSEHVVGPGRIEVHSAHVRKRRGGALDYLLGYATFFVRATRILARLRRERPFDVVEVHNMPDIFTFIARLGRTQSTAVVLDVHDTFPELFETKFGWRARPLRPVLRLEERLSIAVTDAVICVTEEARMRLATRSAPLAKSVVVMNSPDDEVFGPRREPGTITAEGEVRAIYHGGIAPRFGVATAIQAFGLLADSLPRVRLDVHGAMEDFGEFAPLCTDSDPKRVFLAAAPTPFEDIPAVLADKQLGIVPTLHDSFTELLLPVKLLEYIHMGIPVIASRLPAIENYFTENELLFYEPGNARALADAVLAVCADPDAAAVRARAAAIRLDAIAWDRQREIYLELVDRMSALTAGRRRSQARARPLSSARTKRANAGSSTRGARETAALAYPHRNAAPDTPAGLDSATLNERSTTHAAP